MPELTEKPQLYVVFADVNKQAVFYLLLNETTARVNGEEIPVSQVPGVELGRGTSIELRNDAVKWLRLAKAQG